ncbi:ABC transporter ATP-binding protein YtrB [Corynebacterium ciconiae DSM 44920]|uniref:ATP-binding cassette domain-containing protein n=1 Tax=Corynebacterium ciconiae TaxID=227319 RepID=UPI000382252C|nr:ABC transporter ATP-binding protein [Corynebacterium ciconiae]WKD62236.1 ABC transporter ATP-binding protein YtrB [Corynebacterium ciconiae DSM 44920]
MSTVVTKNLSKAYGSATVLKGVNLNLQPGHLYGLLGRNGTGKSTLLTILAGQNKATGGELSVFGSSPFDNSAVMDRCVYAGIDNPYPNPWSVGTIVDLASRRYPRFDIARAKEMAGLFGLSEFKKYADLSRGQRSMVGLIVGLCARAELTLLDEPYLGLDVQNRELFYALLQEEQRLFPRTLVMATHQLEELSLVIDEALVLAPTGQFVGQLPIDELDDAYRQLTVPRAEVESFLQSLGPGVLSRRDGRTHSRLLVSVAALESAEIDQRRARIDTPQLAAVFEALTESHGAAAPAA